MRISIKDRLANAGHSAKLGFCSTMTVQALLAGSVSWSPWRNETQGEGKYRVGVFGLDRADGGFVVVSFRHPGQADHTASYYHEDYQASLRKHAHLGIGSDALLLDMLCTVARESRKVAA